MLQKICQGSCKHFPTHFIRPVLPQNQNLRHYEKRKFRISFINTDVKIPSKISKGKIAKKNFKNKNKIGKLNTT